MARRVNLTESQWERLRRLTGSDRLTLMDDPRLPELARQSLGSAPEPGWEQEPEAMAEPTSWRAPGSSRQPRSDMPEDPSGAVLDTNVGRPASFGRGASFQVQPALMSYKGQMRTQDEFRALRDEEMRRSGQQRTSFGSVDGGMPETPRDRRLQREQPQQPPPENGGMSQEQLAVIFQMQQQQEQQ